MKSEAGRANRQSKLINGRQQDIVIDDIPSPYEQHHINAIEDTDGIIRSFDTVRQKITSNTAIPLHEIYYRQHGQRLIDPKQLALASDVSKIRPTELLQAKYQAVGYSDVTGMRAGLLDWCATGDRSAAGRLIHGAGGSAGRGC